MSVLQALVLGLVQGVTEFLPISSTAHLKIVPDLLGWPDPGAAFSAVLQLGSLVAVLGFFLPDLLGMARAFLDPARRKTPEGMGLPNLILGTIPIGIAGLLLRHAIEGPLRSLFVIAGALAIVAIAMVLVEKFARPHRDLSTITWRDALAVGAAQTLALVPGVSRSGITLVAGMIRGLRRDAAARFSFLLSVPAVGAAGILELPQVLGTHGISSAALAVGLGAAAVSGYASIGLLLRFFRTRTTMPFVVYRIALAVVLVVHATRG